MFVLLIYWWNYLSSLFNLFLIISHHTMKGGQSWSWSYDNWNYDNLCNQRLSQQTWWVRIPLRRGVLDVTLLNKHYYHNPNPNNVELSQSPISNNIIRFSLNTNHIKSWSSYLGRISEQKTPRSPFSVGSLTINTWLSL